MIVLAVLLAVDLVGGWTTHGPGDGASTTEVAVAAGSGSRIFAVAFEAEGESGIYRSEDGGSSWERVSDSPGPDFVSVLAADPHDPDRLFAATVHAGFSVLTTRLFRSDDGGTSWTLKQSFFLFSSSCRIVFDATNPGIVYVVFGGVPSVHRSLDGGETFSAFPTPFPAGDLASGPDETLVAASGFDVFVSRDRAESWTPTSSAPFPCPARVVAVDPNDARRWFVGTGQTAFPCGEIVRTEDGGATWTRGGEAGGPVEGVVLDVAHPGVLYAAIGPADSSTSVGRARASSDWGGTWTDLGLPIVAGASSLALAEDGKRLHAATPGGVYERSFRRPAILPPRRTSPAARSTPGSRPATGRRFR